MDGGAPSARAQTNSTISMYGRILGLSPQAGSNPVDSNIIDLPANDFALLAAIGPILRQFLVPSGIGRTDDAASACDLAIRVEPVKIQIIVTIEIQLSVRAAGSAS